MKYFNHCTSLDEAKKLYHSLALKHHPDRGGDVRIMQEINAEYAYFMAHFARTAASDRQAAAHREGKKTAADFHDLNEVEKELREKIEAALNIAGIQVELCGLWIWLTGETKDHREEIKAIGGFRFSPEKTAWYYPGIPSFNRQRRTMDEIRSMHGSQVFSQTAQEEQPAASLHQ